jgi:DivIVA domain-containing protein
VEVDRQAIERRDFPIARRGYDTAAVDAHLQALAAEFEELQRSVRGPDTSLATAASFQVQSIIAAAETAAAEIARESAEGARLVREEADRDAARTRSGAIEKARGHAAAVSEASSQLLARIGTMDTEVAKLIEGLRAGAGSLERDLAALQRSMAGLYDAASGSTSARETTDALATESVPVPPAPAPPPPAPAPSPPAPPPGPQLEGEAQQAAAEHSWPPAGEGSADVDGARLIALNMALNGEPRDETERYLAENFELPDRVALVDEVYAAIEG